MAPSVHCAGCNQEIKQKSATIKCSKCSEIYDLICAGLNRNKYKSLTSDFVQNWICVSCHSKLPKTSDLKTPVRLLMSCHSSIDGTDTDPEDKSESDTDNVTSHRGNYGTRKQQSPSGTQGSPQRVNKCLCANLDSFRAIIREEMQAILAGNYIEAISDRVVKKMEIASEERCGGPRIAETKLYDIVAASEEKVTQLPSVATKESQPVPERTKTAFEGKLGFPVNKKPKATQSHTQDQNGQMKQKQKQSLGKAPLQSATATNSVPSASSEMLSMQSSLPSSANTNTTVSGDAVASEGWTEVKSTRRSPRISQPGARSPGVLRGTAAPGATLLHAAERRKYVHLYYVKQGTTVDQVRAHLNYICGDNDHTVEALKARGSYASFKLGFPTKSIDLIMAPTNWADGICVKAWRQKFRARIESETSS